VKRSPVQWIEIDAYRPRPDRLRAVAELLDGGGLVAFPTDTTWVVAADAQARGSADQLRELRSQMGGAAELRAPDDKPMSLMCADIAAAATYVLMDQPQFRLVRKLLPGPYTVILPASRQVPRQLQSKRRAVGVRIPDHLVALGVLQACRGPLLVATCHTPDGLLLSASTEVVDALGGSLRAVVETDPIVAEPTTVVDWTGDAPVLVRAGRGEALDDWQRP